METIKIKKLMFVWKKNWFTYVSGYVSELEWIYNVKINYDGCMAYVIGNSDDVNACMFWIERIVIQKNYIYINDIKQWEFKNNI